VTTTFEPTPRVPLSDPRAPDSLSFDELRDAAGQLRPHWRVYFEHLEALGTSEARSRWTKVKQLLQENGTSYNQYGESPGAERPWRLSPIPLMISPQDWQVLSPGIAQRARLLNYLLADLYGPQRSLMDGDLPSELVFDNPHFLRALHGVNLPRNNWLPLYGVEIVRAPNGTFYVLSDSAQAPAGLGYAIENRVVVAHVMSDVLRVCNIERLAGYARLLRARLEGSAPHTRDAPRVVLLTPGPYSATYFEQAYLARFMGLTLVQGEDLTVREHRVYLRTLGGLQPIDAAFRRVFDDYCDPLELRGDSTLGVPGLVEAVRVGNIGLLNPLGTGLLETPALLPFLPGLCRKLLRQELLLPSAPAFYCGNAEHLRQVLAEFDDMVIKPAYVGQGRSIFVSSLAAQDRAALRDRIQSAPHRFVAQRFIPASKTPVISAGSMHSRAFVMRCFATASQPDDYDVMPGGLALVASSDGDLAVSMRHGARSKDVWVISDQPVVDGAFLPSVSHPIELSRGGGDLPSRVADNLFWLGRYTERAEVVGRLARVVGARLLETRGEQRPEFAPLLAALRQQARADDSQDRAVRGRWSSEQELVTAVIAPECPGSLTSAVRAALRVGKVVRDRISHDTWRILVRLDELVEDVRQLEEHDAISRLVEQLNLVVINLAAFSGVMMESMTRGYAWRFLDMGRRLERAISLATLLRVSLVDHCSRESQLLDAILDVADSSMTYRRRYAAGLQTPAVVDLLVADDTNPRSILFQLRTLAGHVAALPPLSEKGVRSLPQRQLLMITSQVELSDAQETCRALGDPPRREGLDALLRQLLAALPSLSDSLTVSYLNHTNAVSQLDPWMK